MTLALIVFVVVVVVGRCRLLHNANGLDILLSDAEALTDEALTVLGIFVGPGRLEPILTQVSRLPGTLQVHLHELDLLGQPVNDPMQVPMSLDFSGDAPICHFVNFLIKYLPVGFVGV